MNAHELQAGPELDALVDAAVFGNRPPVAAEPTEHEEYDDATPGNVSAPYVSPAYSTDAGDAFRVGAAVSDQFAFGRSLAAVLNHDLQGLVYPYHMAQATPLQRCKAALVAVGVASLD